MLQRVFSLRNQLSILATAIAALIISAIPVTITFAQVNYNYNYNGYTPNSYAMPQNSYSRNNYYNYAGMNRSYSQQYLYWCTGHSGGYYSYSPCPQYVPPTYQPVQTHQVHQQYYYPSVSYYYPKQYYYYQPYSYNYGYTYAYNYGYYDDYYYDGWY